MRLLRLHPEVATRDCNHCQRFRYNEGTGAVECGPDNQPLPRFKGEPLPCDFRNNDGSTACPKGTPTAQIALSDINARVYIHYRECKATGSFPNDPVVQQNAAVIDEVERQLEKQEQWKFLRAIIAAKS